MEIVLYPEMFVNNRYTVTYGNREALFTIIDEEFAGNNHLGRINRITVLVREFSTAGKETGAVFCTTVIVMADGIVGVRSDDSALKGKLFTHENMEQCVVTLYSEEQ
jgi:hypothetical protein